MNQRREPAPTATVASPPPATPRDAYRGPVAAPGSNPDQTNSEREELLHHLEGLLDPLMAALGLVFLTLLLTDLAGLVADPEQRLWLERVMTGIWVVFLADFAVRLVVAPAKLGFLRRNWLTAISLVLPFLRPLRALRALRAVRSLSLVRLLGGLNRGMRVLESITRGRQIAYVAALTVLVTIGGAVGVQYFDRDAPDASIRSLGDALWWSAAMVTTINNEKYAVSPEARVIAILVRLFAVSVFGFVTATIASYFVGRSVEERDASKSADTSASDRLLTEIQALRRENELLRAEMTRVRTEIRGLAVQPAESSIDGAGVNAASATADTHGARALKRTSS